MPKRPLLHDYPRLDDLMARAERRLPGFAWAFLSHGSGRETLLDRNRAAYDAVEITPRYMREIGTPNTKRSLFGRDFSLPIGIAPVGLGGFLWPRAEVHLARAAKAANIPFTMPVLSAVSIEDICQEAGLGKGDFLFQLYAPRDEAKRWGVMERAWNAGGQVLAVTVDVPVEPRRETAMAAGLSMTNISLRNIIHGAQAPAWTIGTLRAGLPRAVNFDPYMPPGTSRIENLASIGEDLSLNVTPDVLREIRQRWPGKLVVKGIMHPSDAEIALEAGADGLWVTNHGGRGNDAIPPSLDALPQIRKTVGPDVPILFDSGIRSGLDVLRALSLGADFVFAGRPFYYGLAALGNEGAAHVIDIFEAELTHALGQLGMNGLDEIGVN